MLQNALADNKLSSGKESRSGDAGNFGVGVGGRLGAVFVRIDDFPDDGRDILAFDTDGPQSQSVHLLQNGLHFGCFITLKELSKHAKHFFSLNIKDNGIITLKYRKYRTL